MYGISLEGLNPLFFRESTDFPKAILIVFGICQWWLIGLTLFVCTLIALLVHRFSSQKMRRQLEKLREQRNNDELRQQLSRDIHDDVGANLSKLMMCLTQMEQSKDISPRAISKLKALASNAMEGLTEIVWSVNTDYDRLNDFVAWLRNYAYDFFEDSGIRVVFTTSTTDPGLVIDPKNRRQLLLLFKEVLNNIAKHSQARCVTIDLTVEINYAFKLTIRDDGKGFLIPVQGNRNGLRNMKQRAENRGWFSSITSAPSQGTSVVFSGTLS